MICSRRGSPVHSVQDHFARTRRRFVSFRFATTLEHPLDRHCHQLGHLVGLPGRGVVPEVLAGLEVLGQQLGADLVGLGSVAQELHLHGGAERGLALDARHRAQAAVLGPEALAAAARTETEVHAAAEAVGGLALVPALEKKNENIVKCDIIVFSIIK